MSKLQRITIADVSPPSRLSRLLQALGIRSHTVGPISVSSHEWEAFYGRPQEGRAGPHVDESTALSYSAVWSAVQLISAQVGNLPLVLYKKVGDGKERFEAHPLYRIVHDRPNPEMSAFAFRETLQAHVLLWGNAYAEIERDQANRPIALWPITPDRVMPFRPSNAVLQYRVLNSGGPDTYYDRRDMLHIPGLGFDGICGYSVIAKARESMGLGMATERFGSSFFGNGSTFGGILEHPGKLTETARKNLTESLQRQHQGVERAHKFTILEEGMKYAKNSIPPNDAQFLETRTFQVAEICRWFNLPPHKLKELSRSTNNNIEQQNTEFYIDCLSPWLERWEQELCEKLISPLERTQQELEFVVEGLLRGDSAARGEFHSKQFNVAAITPNEIRATENRNAIKGGDRAFVALNLIPLDRVDEWVDAQIAATKPPPAPPPPQPQPDPNAGRALEVLTEELATARRCTQEAEDAKGVLAAQLRQAEADRVEAARLQGAALEALRIDLAGVQLRLEVSDGMRTAVEASAAASLVEVGMLQTRANATATALSAVVVDRVAWMVERESDRARRVQGSPERLRKWSDQYFAGCGDLYRTVLRPSLRAWAVSKGHDEPVEHLLDILIGQHIEQSVRQFRTLADEQDVESLAPALEKLLRRWEADRAETLVTRVLEAV